MKQGLIHFLLAFKFEHFTLHIVSLENMFSVTMYIEIFLVLFLDISCFSWSIVFMINYNNIWFIESCISEEKKSFLL